MNSMLAGSNIPLINPELLDIEITVPAALRQPLSANRHLMPRFAKSVVAAVQQSLEHPDTKMRGAVTQREVKGRMELAYEAIRIMYYDEKVSLIQAFDILSDVLIDAIRMGQGSGDVTDGRGQTAQARRWGVRNSEERCVTDAGSNLNVDTETEDA